MAISKKYFHDHLVLLLLSINVFLAVLSTIFILVRLGSSHGNGYIVAYLGANDFKTGSVVDLLSLIAFAWLVLVVHTMLSLRAYRIHRQLTVAILSLGLFLLVLNLRVSYALLALH